MTHRQTGGLSEARHLYGARDEQHGPFSSPDLVMYGSDREKDRFKVASRMHETHSKPVSDEPDWVRMLQDSTRTKKQLVEEEYRSKLDEILLREQQALNSGLNIEVFQAERARTHEDYERKNGALHVREDHRLGEGSIVTMTALRDGEKLPITVSSNEPLGRGASAYIYQGTIRRGRQRVAIKVFSSTMKHDARKMFRRELSTILRVAHGPDFRRILPFMGTAMHGGRFILISAFMDNGNLLDFLKRFPETPRREMIVQVAEGVEFLHMKARIVHGDLKCENVLVTERRTAVIADFGLSTTIDKLDHTTATGIRLWNTLAFAAPELHLDGATNAGEETKLRSKTPKSDIYAFGMLVLQAFAGKPPWAGLPDFAIVTKVCNGEKPQRPGHDITALGMTDEWWGVCVRCWEINPHRRPSIDSVLAQLSSGGPGANDYPSSRAETLRLEVDADLSLLPDVPWKEFPRWVQTSRNESCQRLIASNRDVEEKYQADVAAYRAQGQDDEELAIKRHLHLARNRELEVQRLLKDLQVRFLVQCKPEEHEKWENNFKKHPPDLIVRIIQQIYLGHNNLLK